MSWTIHTDLAKFLNQYQPYLFEKEDHNNMLLQGLNRSLQNPSPKTAVLLSSEQAVVLLFDGLFEGSSIVLNEGAAGDFGALAKLVQECCKERSVELKKVIGPEAPVQNFTRAWLQTSKSKIKKEFGMVLHRLDRVNEIKKASGQFRRAWIEDLDLLAEWTKNFYTDTGVGNETKLTEKEIALQSIQNKRLFVWGNNKPVAMAGVSGSTPRGIRVNAVYTPPDKRGQGFGKSIVASVSQLQLDQGKQFLVLYTDTLKPENAALYKQVGYEPIANHLSYSFS